MTQGTEPRPFSADVPVPAPTLAPDEMRAALRGEEAENMGDTHSGFFIGQSLRDSVRHGVQKGTGHQEDEVGKTSASVLGAPSC